MADQKIRREGTDIEPALVKALRQEVEELREENERLSARSREEVEELKLRIAKLKAESQAPQEKEKEVKLPTEVWVIIAKKLDENDVCSFALVSKQLREAQVLAGRKLVTRPLRKNENGCFTFHFFTAAYFTEDWCAYWSRKFNEEHTDPGVIKRVLYVAARHGYLEVFEKYWSQAHNPLWPRDQDTCGWAAFGGHLELVKWLRANGCRWGVRTSAYAARGGQLEVLQWMRAQACPWNRHVCYNAARNGHLEVLRWARSQGCPWNEEAPRVAASKGHLEVLKWLIKKRCPCSKRKCRKAAARGGERARKVLEWLNERREKYLAINV